MMEPEDPSMKGAVQALRDSGVEVELLSLIYFLFSIHCLFQKIYM